MTRKNEVTEKQVLECIKQQAAKIATNLNSNRDVVIKRKAAGELKIQSCNFEIID